MGKNKDKAVHEYLSGLGKKGGSATLKKHGKKHFVKAVNSRKVKKGRYSPGAAGDLERQAKLKAEEQINGTTT